MALSLNHGTGGLGGHTAVYQPRIPQMPRADNSAGSRIVRSDIIGADSYGIVPGQSSGDDALTIDLEEAQYCVLDEKGGDFSLLPIKKSEVSPDNVDAMACSKIHGQTWRSTAELDRVSSKFKTAVIFCRDSRGMSSTPTAKGKSAPKRAAAVGGISLTVSDVCDLQYILAATQGIASSGSRVANVFRRGSSSVAGILARVFKHTESVNSKAEKSVKMSFLNALGVNYESNECIGTTSDAKVLYVDRSEEVNGKRYLYASVVSCELSGAKIMNKYGFGRISTISDVKCELSSLSASDIRAAANLLTRDFTADLLVRNTTLAHVRRNPSISNHNPHHHPILCISQGALRAIVIGTGVAANVEVITSVIHERAALLHPHMKSLPAIQAETGDCALGGCMFSAAELESSKSYIQQSDGSWCVAYQVTAVSFVTHFSFTTACHNVNCIVLFLLTFNCSSLSAMDMFRGISASNINYPLTATPRSRAYSPRGGNGKMTSGL
jgi:hypothetical protein